MYYAYITRIKNLHKHPNADRLQIGECFGNAVVVSLEYADNQLGIYFPSDGQLSTEFAEKNNLVRKKDDAGNNIGGYMDPDKRNVTAIKLRGEKSDGLFLPLTSLDFCFGDTNDPETKGLAEKNLTEGERIEGLVNGHEICKKYIPKKQNKTGARSEGNKTRKHKVDTAPLFTEHVDTEQLAYNLGAFDYGDIVEITLKMHGTSQRTGYLPVLKGYKRTIWDKIFRREGKPIYDWGYVTGTRRVVLENYDNGYYGSNEFREQHSKFFEGKLNKGETVYYEVVGFTTNGTPIMSSCENKKTQDKEFIKQYGQTTVFSYGCSPNGIQKKYGNDDIGVFCLVENVPQSDFYVYRMTFKNEDGHEIDYSPEYVRYRCEQMGCKSVPVFERFMIPERSKCRFENRRLATPGEYVMERAEKYYDGPDPIGKTHVREGIVARIINRPRFAAYKHKNFSFKLLSGITVESVNADQMSDDILSEL